MNDTAALEALEKVCYQFLGDLVEPSQVRCRASYTGDDRWLKRIKVSRNLRTSRTLRDGTLGRLVYLEQLLSSA